jgi:hypothetical protein
MTRSALLLPIVALLAACGDATTAPSSDAAAAPGSPVLERKTSLTCSASSALGAWSMTLQWKGIPVKNITVIHEGGTSTTALDRLTRKGSVTVPSPDSPVGFILDDGTTTVASGGCAAA